ncbi:MAG: LPS-assembly protein LptD [Bdellovibrionales bacterium]|nr:LPS-assembly protein LptD [Bdellovibrionales bacterium]
MRPLQQLLTSYMTHFSFYFFTIFLFLSLGESQGQTNLSGISIHNAQKMSHDTVKKIISLSGNVQVIFQGQYLSCDKASINLKDKTVEAEGQVILQNQKVYAEGEKLVLNYQNNTGTIHRGFLKPGQVVFEGEVIEKTGEDEYVANQSYYSACATCPPAWSFKGSKITAEIGGYASIDYPVLRLGKVPIFALPWIRVPLKSDRQSGFLVPRFPFNKTSKLGLTIPYFWAISRSQDMTLNLTMFKKQGLKPNIEYRYLLSENSKGNFNSSFLEDRFFEQRTKNPSNPDETTLVQSERERWFFAYNHYFEMPEQITHRTNLSMVSDLKYARDFPRDLDTDGEPAIENKVSITKNTEGSHLSGEVVYNINQLVESSVENNNASVHRFPQIDYSLMDRPIASTPLYFGFDTNYVQFARRGLSYDDVVSAGESVGNGMTCPATNPKCISHESDGAFEPSKGDILRTGHRFEFIPRISLPFRISNFLEILPSVTYRETQYRFTAHTTELDTNYTPTAARRYLEMEVGAKTRLAGVFGDRDDDQAVRYKHIIEPELRFSSIPWIRRPNHYFFGNFEGQPYSQTNEPLKDDDFFGLNKVQFDYHDRIFDRRIVDFGVSNRILRRQWHVDHPEYKTMGVFRLSQSYDLNEAESEDPQAWSSINALVDLRLDQIELHSIALYYPYARITNSSSRLRIKNKYDNYVQLGFTRSVLVNKDNEVNLTSQINNIGVALGWTTTYLNLIGGFDYSSITSKIFSWKFEAQIKPPGNCWDITISQFQLPEGQPDWDFGVHFQFGGK